AASAFEALWSYATTVEAHVAFQALAAAIAVVNEPSSGAVQAVETPTVGVESVAATAAEQMPGSDGEITVVGDILVFRRETVLVALELAGPDFYPPSVDVLVRLGYLVDLRISTAID